MPNKITSAGTVDDSSTTAEDTSVSRHIANTMLAEALFRPILFSTQMVEAILEGRKTQTRRVLKLHKAIDSPEFGYTAFTPKNHISVRGLHGIYGESFLKMPYKKGMILWVRETWQQECEEIQIAGGDWSNSYLNATGNYVYKADNISLPKDSVAFGKWKPSLFMPKAACRIWLEVTDVRVERLQEISEEDAVNEGINLSNISGDWEHTPVQEYEELWKSINGQKSWNENPWVWVITFKRVGCPKGFC